MNIAVDRSAVRPTTATTMLQASEAGAFSMRETDGYFRHTSRNEAVIRFIGIVVVLGAFIQWLMPNASFAGDPMLTKVGMSVAFSVVGLAIYSHAMRGHRSEVSLDTETGAILIMHLDRRDGVRSMRRIPLCDIKSIYVLKSETIGTPAKMRIKLYGTQNEITAVRGPYEEIEMAHRQLCRDIRMLQG